MMFKQSAMAVLAASALACTAALAQETLNNEAPKVIDGVETVCDGITIDNRNDAKWRAYSLRLEFVGKGGQYLGDEKVTVKGHELDVAVPAGSYQVSADLADAGHKQMTVQVPANGQRSVVVRFPNAGGEITKPVSEPRVALR